MSADEQRKELEKKLAASNAAVVVLIDELDRVEDEDVRAVAQLVKAVGDIRGISYVVAYDPERVVDALGRGNRQDRERTGSLYLEKIIQHPIPLRPLFENDVRSLLELCTVSKSGLPFSSPDGSDDVTKTIVRSISTPREIKRLVGAFSVLNEMTKGEISPSDLLGYC